MFLITKKRHKEELKKIVDKWGTIFRNTTRVYDNDFKKIEQILIGHAQYKLGGGKKYMSSKAALRGIVQVIEERKARGEKK